MTFHPKQYTVPFAERLAKGADNEIDRLSKESKFLDRTKKARNPYKIHTNSGEKKHERYAARNVLRYFMHGQSMRLELRGYRGSLYAFQETCRQNRKKFL